MIVVPTNPERLVVTQDFVDASASFLFAFWVEPALLCTWWPAEAIVEPEVGGKYRLSWPKIGMTLHGSVLEIEHAKHLRFSWSWIEDTTDEPLFVDVWFEDIESGARLGLEHGIYDGENATQSDRNEHIEGWQHFLDKLAQAVKIPRN